MSALSQIGQLLLRLKHWHVFLLLIFFYFVRVSAFPSEERRIQIDLGSGNTFTYSEAGSGGLGAILVNLIGLVLFLSVGLFLINTANRRIGAPAFSRKLFVGLTIAPLVWLGIAILVFRSTITTFQARAEWSREHFPVQFVILLVAIVMLFGCMVYMARAIDSAEQRRPAPLADYMVTFILIVLYFPITMWVLQPRLNRLAANEAGQGDELPANLELE